MSGWDRAAVDAVLGMVLDDCKAIAPDAEVSVGVSAGRTANTRFARSEMTSTGEVEQASVGVTVAFGLRQASVSGNQTDPASLRDLVDRAVRLARLAPEDPERMPFLGPQTYAPAAAGAWDDATAALATATRAEAVAGAIAAADGAGVEIAGFYEHGSSRSAQATSAGCHASFASTWASISTTARTPDGTGSGWAAGDANRAADLDPNLLVARAIDKAKRSASPRKLEPGRYTVVLEPHAAADLVGFLVGSMDARAAEEGRSFFSKPKGKTKQGDRLFPKSVTVIADPFDPATPAPPYDGEGTPRQRTVLVEQGVVRTLQRSRFWAAKTNTKPTADPGPWQLLGGRGTLDDLVAGVDRGLLVTRFWYLRWLDPQSITITGLTRDGVFLVEGGKVVGPVNNFRFNHSLVTLLANADGFGGDLVRTGGSRMPSVRSHDFLMASVSEAV